MEQGARLQKKAAQAERNAGIQEKNCKQSRKNQEPLNQEDGKLVCDLLLA